MAKIRNEISVDSPADQVWEVLRRFGDNHEWSDMLSGSTLEGDTRVCTLGDQSPAPGAVLREKLIAADDALLRLEYTVTEAPFPVEFHNAVIDVIPGEGESSTVSWTTTVVPDELAAMFSPGFDSDLQSLKNLVEAG